MRSSLVATLIAEGAALDAFTGRATAFNLLDTVVAPRFPAALPKFIVITIYDRGDEEDAFTERLRLIRTGNNRTIIEATAVISIAASSEGNPPSHRSFHSLAGIVFEQPGDYLLTVERTTNAASEEWELLGKRRLLVTEGQHPFSASIPVKPPAGGD